MKYEIYTKHTNMFAQHMRNKPMIDYSFIYIKRLTFNVQWTIMNALKRKRIAVEYTLHYVFE